MGFDVDKDGYTALTEMGGRCIKIFDPKGELIQEIGKGTLDRPVSVVVTPDGDLVTADRRRGRIYLITWPK